MMPLWGHYTHSLGGSLRSAGTVLSCYFLSIGVSALIFSLLSARFPYYYFFCFLASLGASTMLFLLASVKALWMLYALEAGLGFCVGIVLIMSSAILAIMMPHRLSTVGWSIYTFVQYLGIGFASLLGAHIVHYSNYHILFFISSLVLLICAVLTVVLMLLPVDHPHKHLKELAVTGVEPVFKRRSIYFLLMSISLFFSALSMITPLWSHYVSHLHGTLKETGIAVGIYFWGYAFFNLFFGYFEQRFKQHVIYVSLSFFLTACVFLAYLFVHSVFTLYALQFLLALFASMQSPAFDDTYARQLHPRQQALGQGLYVGALFMAWGVGAYLGSHIANRFGFSAVFISMSLIGLLGFIIVAMGFYFHRQRMAASLSD